MIIGKAVIPGKQKPIAPPAPVVQEISFFIDNTEHHADEGMTWADWVNSEYNYIGAQLVLNSRTNTTNIFNSAKTYHIADNTLISPQVSTDIIIENASYMWSNEPLGAGPVIS